MAKEIANIEVRLQATAAKFDQQMKKAERSFSTSTDKIDRRADRTNQKLNKMGAGMSGAMRARVGNVGNQLQDVIVQAQMGTDAFRILGQQGPQLAGAFGPFGALLGVLVAGFAALAPFVLRSNDAAMDFKRTSEALDKVQKSLTDSQGDLTKSLDDLQAKYGESADAAQRLLVVASTLSLQKARDEFASLATTAAETLEKITTEGLRPLNSYTTTSAFDAALSRYQAQISELASLFGVTVEEAMALNDAMREFANAPTLSEKAEAAKVLADRMDEFGVKVERLPPVIRDALSEMTGVTLQFLEAKKNADDLDAALGRGVDTTGSFVTEAERLRQSLDDAARSAERAYSMATTMFSVRFRDEESLMSLPVRVTAPPPRKPPRRSGGGRSRAREDTTGERLMDRMNERLEKLREETALIGLNEAARVRLVAAFDRERMVRELLEAAARDGATIGDDEVAQAKALAEAIEAETLAMFAKEEAIDRMNERIKEANREQERMAENVREVSDRLISAVSSANSFADALKRVGFEMIAIAAQSITGSGPLGGIVNKGLGVASGGLISALFSAKGNVFSRGDVVPFAKGGVVNGPTSFPMPRGMGVMGEAGPEAIMPLQRGPGGRLGVAASGGGGPVINIYPQYSGVNGWVRAVIQEENTKLKGEIMRAIPGRASQGFRQQPGLRR